jgi:hypothetical protein
LSYMFKAILPNSQCFQGEEHQCAAK